MIRFRTLGAVDLRAEDQTEIRSVLQQPKRLAMLVYLTCARPRRFHRRDKLLGLFWAEQEEYRARHALSQSIYALRRDLGGDVVLKRGDDEVGLAEAGFVCDATEFDALLDAGSDEAALELYHGELLPGFFLAEAPDFTQWLDVERARLAKRAEDAAWRVAERFEKADDLARACNALRRVLEFAPTNEGALRKLMVLLDAQGEPLAALRAYDEFARRMQTEYDLTPSEESSELADGMRERLTSTRTPVLRSGEAGTRAREGAAQGAEPLEFADASSAGSTDSYGRESARDGRPRWLGIAAAVAVVALAVVVAIWKLNPFGDAALADNPDVNNVAVLYFNDDSPGHDIGHIAAGMTTALIDELSHVKRLHVISDNGVRAVRGKQLRPDSIARIFHVGSIVGGSVSRSGDMLRVSVELIDPKTGTALKAKRLERRLSELFQLQDEVADEVARFLRVELGQEVRHGQLRAGTHNSAALDLMYRAEEAYRAVSNTEDGRNAAAERISVMNANALFAQAEAIDPLWIDPVIMRGNVARRLAMMSLASSNEERGSTAVWLDSARMHADRAVSLQPENASALELRGVVAYWRWLILRNPRVRADSLVAASIKDLHASLQREPDRPRAQSTLSAVLYSRGEFAEAKNYALRAYNADAYMTDASETVNRLFMTSFESGDDDEASRWCDEVRHRQPGRWPYAYCSLLMLGWSLGGDHDPRKALNVLETFGSSDPPEVRAVVRPMLLVLAAASFVRAGQRDRAEALIQEAHATSAGNPDLLPLEAGVRVMQGDWTKALELLRTHVALQPESRRRIARSRMFEPLRSQPGFALLASRPPD
jgi:DNA-binding SARP family transcriptional activator/TolB-like protein